LEKNKSERHIRGGMATKQKYEIKCDKNVGWIPTFFSWLKTSFCIFCM
jgi:hypothetical protein